MAIHKFAMLFKNLEKHLGKEGASEIFPEYESIPEKMNATDQTDLARRIMDRMDKLLDRETIVKIRHGNSCNFPKKQRQEMLEIMSKCKNTDEFLTAYGYIRQDDRTYLSNFKSIKCYCGLFRKLDKYEPISITWCECCNGHHEKGLQEICRHPIKTELIESISSGGKSCVTRVTVL